MFNIVGFHGVLGRYTYTHDRYYNTGTCQVIRSTINDAALGENVELTPNSSRDIVKEP
jgi:hypothetical protein